MRSARTPTVPSRSPIHGYDTKFAMHALRLGVQGVELLTSGRITLPIPEPDLSYLRAVRRGEVELADVVEASTEAEARLLELSTSAAVPEQPDRAWVDGWLHRRHLAYWGRPDLDPSLTVAPSFGRCNVVDPAGALPHTALHRCPGGPTLRQPHTRPPRPHGPLDRHRKIGCTTRCVDPYTLGTTEHREVRGGPETVGYHS